MTQRFKVSNFIALVLDDPGVIDLVRSTDPDNCLKCKNCQPFKDVFQCEQSGGLMDKETLRTHSCMGYEK